MPKYNVHLYPIYRATFRSIEASTPQEAAKIASDRFNPRDLEEPLEFGEAIDGATVDTVGDDSFEHTIQLSAKDL